MHCNLPKFHNRILLTFQDILKYEDARITKKTALTKRHHTLTTPACWSSVYVLEKVLRDAVQCPKLSHHYAQNSVPVKFLYNNKTLRMFTALESNAQQVKCLFTSYYSCIATKIKKKQQVVQEVAGIMPRSLALGTCKHMDYWLFFV